MYFFNGFNLIDLFSIVRPSAHSTNMIKQIQIDLIVYTYVHSHRVNMINKQYGQVSDSIASRCLKE